MCVLLVVAFLGPRTAIVVWWLLDTSRWNAAFGSIIWPILGLILMPWTTLVFVLVASDGVTTGFDWVLLLLALAFDLTSSGGSAVGYRARSRRSRRYS